MDVRHNLKAEHAYPQIQLASPLTSDRIRALATRAMEGAPSLTAGEMRELAEAILEHQAQSCA